MPRYVALLRGVNVGKGHRVSMTELKALLERLGYSEVSTLLNSGNAVFTSTGRSSRQHASAISAALGQTLAISTPVVVKSAAEFAEILKACPKLLPKQDHSKCLVAFASEKQTLQTLQPLEESALPGEHFSLTAVAAFLYCPSGIAQSKLAESLLGKAGKHVTTRNWATVMKLAALLGIEQTA